MVQAPQHNADRIPELKADHLPVMGKLEKRWEEGKFLCVGLDTQIEQIPEYALSHGHDKGSVFNRGIIDATAEYACSYKLNLGAFLNQGDSGLEAMNNIISYVHLTYPGIPVFIDAKVGDVASSNRMYNDALMVKLGADGVTLNSYVGEDALEPFLRSRNRMFFVLAKTSNPDSDEIQNRRVRIGRETLALYEFIARQVSKVWNGRGNLGIVAGATHPEDIAKVREAIGPKMPILMPGIGAQGGDLEASVRAGLNQDLNGILLSVSRDIMYAYKKPEYVAAYNYKEAAKMAAKAFNDRINAVRAQIMAERGES